MAFNLEDQYQQYLYPTEINVSKEDINKNRTRNNTKYQNKEVIKILLTNRASKPNKKLIAFFKKNLDFLNNKKLVFDWIVVYSDEIEYYEEQGISEFPTLIFGKDTMAGVANIIDYLQNIAGLQQPPPQNRPRRTGRKVQSDSGGRTTNGDEEVRNYLLNEIAIGNDDNDVDEDDVFQNTITQRMASMNKQRSQGGQPSSSMSNPEIHDRNARNASRQHNYGFNNDPEEKYEKPQQHRQIIPRANNIQQNMASVTGPSTVDIAARTNRGSMDDDMMMKFWENQEETPM